MSEKILCVDDETHVLDAYRRALRKNFLIETALSGPAAIQTIDDKGPFAVIVSDMRMPGMDGIQLLTEVKRKTPDTVRVMLTGNSDQQTAMDAVNEGSIFRFLTKPCKPETLAQTLDAGVRQYRLVTAEKELLGKTLRGSIKVLSDVLSLVNPIAFGHTSRIQKLVKQIAKELGISGDWKNDMAAMLSHIGCVTIPHELFEKAYRGDHLKPDEMEMFNALPSIAHDLVGNIPRMKEVAEIIAYQEKHYDGGGIPINGKSGTAIPLGSRVLKVARDFDMLDWQGIPSPQALSELRGRTGWYDPSVLEALEKAVGVTDKLESRMVAIKELVDTMILADNVEAENGLMIAPKGTDVTPSLRQRLLNFARKTPVKEPIAVLILDE